MGQGCQFTNVSRSKAGRPGQHPTGSGGRLIPMGAGGQHGPPRGGRARVWAPSCPLAPGLGTETRIHTPFSLLRISQASDEPGGEETKELTLSSRNSSCGVYFKLLQDNN